MSGGGPIEPTDEQRAVRDSEARQIIVAAGAGTGKTTTTMFRFGRLLDAGVELGQILVFTFTEKAAGELADQVRETSGHRLNPVNPGAATMSEAWVGTFHSICARILRSFPIEAGIDPGFGVLDEVDSAALRSTAARQAIRDLLEEMPAAEAVVARFRLEALEDEVRNAYDELRARGIARPGLPEREDTGYPREVIEKLRETAQETSKVEGLHHSPRKTMEALVEMLDRTVEGLTVEKLGDFGTTSKNRAVDPYKEDLGKAKAALAAYEDGDLTYRATDRLIRLYGDRYSALKEADSVLDFEDLQIRTLELLTDPDRPQVGDYYRARFREIMVDEFQDTNGLQLRLINALSGPDTTVMTVGDEMQSIYRFRHANVELFRNRRDELAQAKDGADLTLRGNNRSDRAVIDAVNLIGRTLHDSAASATERDEGARHDFMDLVKSAVSPRGDGEPGDIRLLLIERGNWDPFDLGEISPAIPQPETEEQLPEAKDGDDDAKKKEKKKDKPPARACHEAEALAVANAIRDLLDDPENDFQQKDVAILLRAMTRSGNYEKALRQVGLTPYVISGRGFWESRVAIETRSLLRLIANPLDEKAVLAALLSPACGLSPDGPLILRQGSAKNEKLWSASIRAAEGEPGEEGWFERLSAEDRESLASFVEVIEGIRSTAELMPLDELVEAVASRTGYDLAVLTREAGSFPDLKRIASIARTYEDGHRRDLRGFLDWMEASETVDSEASVAIEDEQSDVVRIMTVHAAKGDQFEVVAVPDLGREFRADSESLLMLGSSGDPEAPEEFEVGVKIDGTPAYSWEDVAAESRVENEDEELRLFHVAITRARSHLILSGCPPDVKQDDEISPTTSIATRICKAAEIPTRPDEERAWRSEPRAPGWSGVVSVEVVPADEDTALMLSAPKEPYSLPEASPAGSPPLGRPEATTHPVVPLSFTALLEYATCPALFFARRVLRMNEGGIVLPGDGPENTPLGGRDDATSFGNAVHDLLETISTRKWKAPTEQEIRDALSAERLSPEDEALVRRAGTMIDDFLASDLGATVGANASRAEVPLLLRCGAVTIRGFIDLLVDTDVPTVIDFKTNALDGSSPVEKMAGGYDLQRDLYALAVAEARRIDSVATAFIFLEAADRPVIEEYGPTELEEARARIEGLVAGVSEGRYFEESEVSRPCRECWACRRLGIETEG